MGRSCTPSVQVLDSNRTTGPRERTWPVGECFGVLGEGRAPCPQPGIILMGYPPLLQQRELSDGSQFSAVVTLDLPQLGTALSRLCFRALSERLGSPTKEGWEECWWLLLDDEHCSDGGTRADRGEEVTFRLFNLMSC